MITTVFFILCTIFVALLASRKPAHAIPIVAFFFPFENYYTIGTITVTSNELLILGVCSGIAVRFIRGNASRTMLWRTMVPILPYVIVLCISASVCPSRWLALKDIARWLSFLAVYLAAALSFRTYVEGQRLARWLVAAAVPAALFGIFQAALGPASAAFELEPHSRTDSLFCLTTGWRVRAHSFFNQANSFACYLAILLPVCLFVAGRTRTKHTKVLSALLLLTVALAIMLTLSRASWLLAAASVVAIWLLSRKKREAAHASKPARLALATLLAAALLLAMFAAISKPDIDFLVSRHSALQRLKLFQTGLQMARQKPLLGFGPGNYHAGAAAFKVGPQVQRIKRAHLHNLYLQVAVESGVLGLAAFLFFVVHTLRTLARGLRACHSGRCRTLAASILVSASVFFAYNLIDIFRYHGVHLVAAAVMGCGIGLTGNRRAKPRP